MKKTYIVCALCGLIGGIVGANFPGQQLRSLLPQAAAASAQDVISASRIRLVDPTGRARAELATSPDGGAGLFFYDSHGRNRLVLGLYSAAEGEYRSSFSETPSKRRPAAFACSAPTKHRC